MLSQANIFLTLTLVSVITVNAKEYTFGLEKPVNYPNFTDNAFVKEIAKKFIPTRVKRSDDYDYGSEVDESDSEGRFCQEVVMDPIQPYTIKANNNIKYHVVQSPENFFRQEVQQIECQNPDKPSCFSDFENMWQGTYKAECTKIKNYIYVVVTVPGTPNHKPQLKSFEINVGCACSLKKIEENV